MGKKDKNRKENNKNHTFIQSIVRSFACCSAGTGIYLVGAGLSELLKAIAFIAINAGAVATADQIKRSNSGNHGNGAAVAAAAAYCSNCAMAATAANPAAAATPHPQQQ